MTKPTKSAVARPRGRPSASANAAAGGTTLVFRPDGKGRITLGKLAEGVSGYTATVSADGELHLVPHVEIPAREMWIFENPAVLMAIQQGMQQSREGAVVERDFSQFASDDDAVDDDSLDE